MSSEITLLAITAASIGFFHTLFGPDHYLPFIMMSKDKTNMGKTLPTNIEYETINCLFCGDNDDQKTQYSALRL